MDNKVRFKGRGRKKSALEGGSSEKKAKKHQCHICKQLGHHWYTCKNRNPEDIAAMKAVRGLPKKKVKKTASCNTETIIVVATPNQMVFAHIEAVANATANKRKRREASGSTTSSSAIKKSKRDAPTTSHEAQPAPTSVSSRSAIGSNNLVPLQSVHLAPFTDDSITVETEPLEVVLARDTPRRKIGIRKKLTPKKLPVSSSSQLSPASHASNTRSKKQLYML